jgi:hypothetical protein
MHGGSSGKATVARNSSEIGNKRRKLKLTPSYIIQAASHFKRLAKIQFLTIECRLELGETQITRQAGGRMRHGLSGYLHAALTFGGVSW